MNLASGLSVKSHGPLTPPYHPITFRWSGWEYMVQIEAQSTPACWEGGQRKEEQRVVLHIQVEHFQNKTKSGQ